MGKGRLKQALDLSGSQHRYQKVLVTLLMFAWVAMTFVFLSSPFVYMDPLFHCVSKGNHLVHQKQACRKIQQCSVIDDFTIVAQVGMYCGKSWARVTVQSIFPLGSFVGLMIMNLVSDTKGRRMAFLSALGIQLVSIILSLVGGTSGNIFLLIVAQFLGGFGSYSIMPLAYTLISDFLSDHFRPKAIVMLNASGGVATVSLGLFYLMKLNWFYFVVFFQLIPFACLFVTFYYFLQESPYILMNHNQVEHAEQVFMRIAKFNGKQQNIPQIKRIIELQQQRDHQRKPSLKNVFRTVLDWRYLKMIILLIAINSIANLNYFGISYSFAQQGLGYGYNSMVMGFVQGGAILFLTYTASHVPRRPGIAAFFTLTMLIGLLYFTDFIRQNLFLSTLFIGISRICAINGYCLVACMQTEAFTVSIQSTAAGLIEGFGIIGGIVAPFTIQIAEQFDVSPIAVCAIFVSCAIWPAYFLRETFHMPPVLPDNTPDQLDQPLVNEQELDDLTSSGNSKQKIDLKFGTVKEMVK